MKLDKLPEDASETLRLVRLADYDVCHFVPMHFVAAGFESAWRMEEFVQPPAHFWRISREGETYNM